MIEFLKANMFAMFSLIVMGLVGASQFASNHETRITLLESNLGHETQARKRFDAEMTGKFDKVLEVIDQQMNRSLEIQEKQLETNSEFSATLARMDTTLGIISKKVGI